MSADSTVTGAPAALLLDTSSLFYRAHFALPPMSTRAGEPTSAIYGLSALVLKLLREERPAGLAFARDLPLPTLRHERYPGYKANRPAMPDVLRPQWARLDELVAALGVPSLAVPGFEADDVRLPTLFALVGEASDNLVGVPGVGMHTATRLVADYGTAARLISDLHTVTPLKIRDALRDAGARVLLNEELARLHTDLELGPGPLVEPVTAKALERVRALFEVLEFKSLTARLDAIAATLRGPG